MPTTPATPEAPKPGLTAAGSVDKVTIKERIGSFFQDVVTLDVLTLTGSISLVPEKDAAGKAVPFTWDGLFAQVASQMQPKDDNVLEVVAYTHAEWDLDSVQFVTKDITPGTSVLVDAHNAGVKSAQASRFEAIKTLGSLIGLDL